VSRTPLIYWDSSVFLAWLKPEASRRKACREILDEAEAGKLRIVASAITLTEVIKLKDYPALKADNEAKIANFFRQPYLVIHQVNRRIGEDARRLIWKHPKLHPKDSIHLATAEYAKVLEVHTYDGKHMLPLDGLIGNPALRICEPQLDQSKLPFEEPHEDEAEEDQGEAAEEEEDAEGED
jgi:predicted nucleic acid-binding protein